MSARRHSDEPATPAAENAPRGPQPVSAGRAPLVAALLCPEHVLALQRSAGNAAVNKVLLMRSPASELIDRHTSWMDLNEPALGAALRDQALAGRYDFVQNVLDELGSTDRDDVSYEMTRQTSDPQLTDFGRHERGRAMLDRIFDELTSGSVASEEQAQADRIMRVKARQISPDAFAAGMANAKVFPFRLPGMTVLNDAPIMAERRPGGRIWVKQPVRVLGTSAYRRETGTLPTGVFTSGIELPENEIVGVRLYDLGGDTIFRPALILVQLSNENDTTTLTKIAEIVGLGLTLGTGALAGLGVRAGMMARVLLWADRAATVLGTAASVIHEHRGAIIERFGDDGRRFVRALEYVQSATAIYGFARVAIALPQLVNGLRTGWQGWRTAARGAEAEMNTAERAAVRQLDDATSETLEQADAVRGARSADEGAPGGTAQADAPDRPPRSEAGPSGGGVLDELERGVRITRDVPGGGQLKLLENGRVVLCHSPCTYLELRYARELSGTSGAAWQRRLDAIAARERAAVSAADRAAEEAAFADALTLEAELRAAHRRYLGTDVADAGGRFRAFEADAAEHIEQTLGRPVERLDPDNVPAHRAKSGDWFDPVRRVSYDAVGPSPRYDYDQFTAAIRGHIKGGLDYMWVDLTLFNQAQQQQIITFIRTQMAPYLARQQRPWIQIYLGPARGVL